MLRTLRRLVLIALTARVIAAPVALRTIRPGEPRGIGLTILVCDWPAEPTWSVSGKLAQQIEETAEAGLPPAEAPPREPSAADPGPRSFASCDRYTRLAIARQRC